MKNAIRPLNWPPITDAMIAVSSYNMSVFFTLEELRELSEAVQTADLKILNIESRFFSGVEKEKVTYIDNDLCEIVDNGN